jgi:glycosyltransferase involved in cell wall biosynthesis
MPPTRRPRAIVLHDVFRMKGGGERMALILAQHLADALCYGYSTPESFDLSVLKHHKLYDLHAQGGPFGLRMIKLMHAFRRKTEFLREYDVAIYQGFFTPLAVHNHTRGPNIYYCNAPPRFAYDQYDFHMSLLPFWKRTLSRAYMPHLRKVYEAAVDKMDVVVANSRNIKMRIRSYLNVETVIVHPPCDTRSYKWLGQEDYYLSTARLDPLKRVDVIVEAFKLMPDRKLVICSGGSEAEKLRKLAADAPNIRFTGWIDESVYQELVGKCLATVYIPTDEDYGLSPVESMAAGKPVIGVQEGGLLETVLEGETGLLVPSDPTPEQVVEAVLAIDKERALEMRPRCEERAKAFDTDVFLKKMKEILLSLV